MRSILNYINESHKFLVKQHTNPNNSINTAIVLTNAGKKRHYVILDNHTGPQFCKSIKNINTNINLETLIDVFDDIDVQNNEKLICVRPKYNHIGFVLIERYKDKIKMSDVKPFNIENFTVEYWETTFSTDDK